MNTRKGCNAEHPIKTPKRPPVRLLWIEYRRVHKDDQISEDTVRLYVTQKKKGKMVDDPARLLRELWDGAKNENEIAKYYNTYTGWKINNDRRGYELDDTGNEYNPDYEEGYTDEEINEYIV